MEKLNCWEFMKCGRGPDSVGRGGEVCPAATEKRLDTIHGGSNSGRACWVVAGTHCGGTVQGTHARKLLACKRCDFYRKVHREEGEGIERTPVLLDRLREPVERFDIRCRRLVLLLGGSGLIGGTLLHYFKTRTGGDIEVLAPNSKKLSLREPEDVRQYIEKYRPDCIINAAIASIDADAQLCYEINCLGAVRLAKLAQSLKIPYLHFSSAAVLRAGEDLGEHDYLPLNPLLSNYAKSKLMAEKILAHLHDTQGLDYTVVRLAVVYGKHDHKIQGAHRLLFSIADQAMPLILSKPGVCHSYSNCKKIPHFVHHLMEHRAEFSGQTYNFVDPEPVELVALIKAVKAQLGVRRPREFYIPYSLATLSQGCVRWLIRRLASIGVEARVPAEVIFLKNFYVSQTLSAAKLAASSFVDPSPDTTVFTALPSLLGYYLKRWRHLNRLAATEESRDYSDSGRRFNASPQEFLARFNASSHLALEDLERELEEHGP